MPDATATADGALPSPALKELAGRYGVAVEYDDWQGNHLDVPASTVVAVLAALDVDADGEDAVEAALAEVDLAPWRAVLPPVVVLRDGRVGEVAVHVPHGQPVACEAVLEDGRSVPLAQLDRWTDPREVDGALVGRATFAVPADTPLGWHELRVRVGAVPGGAEPTATAPLVVTPSVLELPAGVRDGQHWGLMVQLYSVRSRLSWGLGDAADLAELASWSGGEHGADFVLVNPLHAAEPVAPMEPSPYLPTTRRFVNPVYIRVEDVRETAYLPSADRALLEWAAEEQRAASAAGALVDRDAVWAAKRSALRTVFDAGRTAARAADFAAFREREGKGLTDFATWCALADRHGLPSSQWPEGAHDHGSREQERLVTEVADDVRFHEWLQWVVDEQLDAAQRTATRAGMALGVVHDLAVGVHPTGADTWTLGPALARGITVGAPPDAFNQQGQDWSQPPWRPDGLARLGYAPYRDMIRTVLRHAGGVRVDHVMGLFRLWWVPAGLGPEAGTYVRYDHEAMVGILALEAQRAGAVVVGEDLGVVEPWVRDHLRERGVLGTSVLWFERDGDGAPLPPERWRELCMATVTTHDLPPTAGYLAGEHIDLRDRLGLLTRDVEEERRVDERDRASVLAQLSERGLVPEDPTERQLVDGLHRLLRAAPSRLLGVSLPDAVGERRTQNQPGTYDQYPNWRVPLGDSSGDPVLLEDLPGLPRVRSLLRALLSDDPPR
ncbi:4-alpha-glucanotransferase [uncultured Pseudokineococcus sp.]|uniref:4-alpha-glucanotransferase n=1 Tax=uncultured Pseudokineococcus sp. TaxID=1642928 RepID=UPI002624A97A|nr:4-alpha-glucanotransferase [uncultured Pseudokineococcus sp.]